MVPLLFIGLIVFSLTQWKFDPALNNDTAVLFGYQWQWTAIIEYSFLFIALLYLYNQKLAPLESFFMSFFSVFLAGLLYELPWYALHEKIWGLLTEFNYIYTGWFFTLVLFARHIKLNLILSLTFIPIILIWTYYWRIPGEFVRLGVFPLFLLLPYCLPRKQK